MRPDPLIDDIRVVRTQISKRFKHEPNRLITHYIKMQERYKSRLLKPQYERVTFPADIKSKQFIGARCISE